MLEIRRAGETDNFGEISRIYALSWKTAYRGMIPDDYLDEISETRWSPVLRRDAKRLLLAAENARVVGAATYDAARDPKMSGCGEIISLYLLPSHYRKGIGTELFAAVVNALREAGFACIYLWVLEDNAPARAFYEKNGFFFNGDVNADNIGGRAVNEVRYVRCL